MAIPMAQRVRQGAIYWPCGGVVDGLRSTIFDARGPYDLTNSGVTGRTGPSVNLPEAADFTSASGDNLSTADVVSFAPGRCYTMGCWVIMDVAQNQAFVSQFNTTGNQRGPEIDFLAGPSAFRFIGSTDGASGTAFTFSSTGTLSTAAWYRVFAAWDGAHVHLYINGKLDSVHTLAGPIFNSTDALTIGARPDTTIPLDGGLQGVVLMPNRCITAEEVHWDWNAGRGRDWTRGV